MARSTSEWRGSVGSAAVSATLRVETPHARQAQPQKHTRAATKRVRARDARWQAQSGVCTCALARSRARGKARERESGATSVASLTHRRAARLPWSSSRARRPARERARGTGRGAGREARGIGSASQWPPARPCGPCRGWPARRSSSSAAARPCGGGNAAGPGWRGARGSRPRWARAPRTGVRPLRQAARPSVSSSLALSRAAHPSCRPKSSVLT